MSAVADISKYLKIAFFVILLAWISFFPQPIQQRYQVFMLSLFIFAFLFLLIRKGNTIFKRNDFPLWIFLVAISINVIFAQNRNIAFRTYLDLVIPIFFIYYLFSENISSDMLGLLTKIICILSILVCLGALLDFLLGTNFLYEYLIPNPFYERYKPRIRAISTQFHPTVLGTYLLASLPFNFLLVKQDKSFARILGILAVILSFPIIILTFSRSVLLGTTVFILFLLFVNKRRKLIVIFLIILTLFIFLNSYLPFPYNKLGCDGFLKYGDSLFSSFRLQRYIMLGRVMKAHPFAGLGFQHVRLRFYEYFPAREIIPYEFMIMDNMYLTILAESGIIGFLGFFIFIFSILTKVCKSLENLKNLPRERQKLIFILSGFIGLLVAAAGYELFYWPGPYIYFCIFIGLIEAFYRNAYKYRD